MDKKELQKYAENLWLEYCLIFPKLVKYDCPDIILNNRFTKTAGCNYQEVNVVHIAAKFMPKHKSAMLSVILPHELAHQIDFNLYGASEKKCGHGKSWCRVMEKIGLPATRYHSLEI